MFNVEDIELARRVASGDAEAIARFVDRLYPSVFRFLWHASGSKEEAEDLASQAFLRARGDIHRFRGDGSLSAWMYSLARREYLRYRRRQALANLFRARTVKEVVPPHNEDFILVQDALARLPENQRAVFLLVEVEGLTTEEAARAIGAPVGTVKSRCFHAKKRLREILGPAYPEISNYAQPIPD
jgi:RNA polymerase sigma-70 factor (ECF subfamily)